MAEGERINEQVNRSWNRLRGRWADFKKAIANKQSGDPTTTETRDRWLYPIFHDIPRSTSPFAAARRLMRRALLLEVHAWVPRKTRTCSCSGSLKACLDPIDHFDFAFSEPFPANHLAM
jgi:hypothetical protein